MKTKWIFGVSFLGILATSCINFNTGVQGNGEVISQERSVNEPFTEISASEGLDVYITQGETSTIKVEADSNVIDLIATDIKEGKLRVHTTEGIGRATKSVYVTLPEITAIKATSGSDVVTENTIRGTEIRLSVTSGADLTATVVAESLEADTSSGGSMRISGETDALKAGASSGSDLKAGELMAKNVTASASSGAFVKVHASENLVANASSGADIRYSGGANVNRTKSAGGNVSSDN